MQKKIRWIFACVLAAGAIMIVLQGLSRRHAIEQPINFNHKTHVEGGLECIFCHPGVETGAHAGILEVSGCMVCHEADVSDSPEARKVQDYGRRNENIPWVQVHKVPDDIYYSHRRHAILGKLECATCHGDITKETNALRRPMVKFTMDWCMDCHKRSQVTNDCLACHK